MPNGRHIYAATATDSANFTSPNSSPLTVTVDLIKPKIKLATPAGLGVKRNTNLTATFSEKMKREMLTKSTFMLYRVDADGSTTQITNVSVTPSSDGLKATLNPYGTSTTLLAKYTK